MSATMATMSSASFGLLPSTSRRSSPPRTPPMTPVDAATITSSSSSYDNSSQPHSRPPSTTPSDDSSILLELSFDYVYDENGEFVRIQKGSPSHNQSGASTTSTKSERSSPLTPQDSTEDREYERQRELVYEQYQQRQRDLLHAPLQPHAKQPQPSQENLSPPSWSHLFEAPSPVLLNSPLQRMPLSRSESAHSVLISSNASAEFERAMAAGKTTNAAGGRSYKRVTSGPAVLTPGSTAGLFKPGAASSSTLAPGSKPRSTLPRRVPASSEDHEDPIARSRSSGSNAAGSSRTTTPTDDAIAQEEKENYVTYGDDSHPYASNGHGSHLNGYPASSGAVNGAGKRLSPSGPQRIAASVQASRSTLLMPTRASAARGAEPARPDTQASQRVRQIAGRAVRVLKAKYGVSGNGTKSGGFDKISEVESTSEAENVGDETDTGGDEQNPGRHPPLSSRQRTYGGVNSLSHSGSSRPRRSASLSDAGSAQDEHGVLVQTAARYQQQQYARPGSSLGSNGNARRVTTEQKERELLEYKRKVQETQAHADAYGDQRQPSPQGTRSRQSPSPTHVAVLGGHPAYGHKRRDSDTIRSTIMSNGTVTSSNTLAPPPSSSSLTLTPSSSPTLASPTVVEPARLSPSSRNFPTSVRDALSTNTNSVKHRRSPTAPEPPTTSGMIAPVGGLQAIKENAGKTWAAGEYEREVGDGRQSREGLRERERERERGREKERERERKLREVEQQQAQAQQQAQLQQQQQQQQLLQQAQMQQAPAKAQSAVPGGRQIVVNKKVYARLDMIGKGGSSRVFRVLSQSSELFAIKRVSLDKTDAETLSGYMNEIALLKRLDGNSRIIRLFDSEVKAGPGGAKGHLSLVMECGEIDLLRLLQDRQGEALNIVWVSYYWQQMLQAVHVIHEEKIVHSDLKPANFVLVRGQLKLIDFGIANAIANDTTNIQRDHQIGTVNYMSPEAIELPDGMRRLKVGRQSDVWSLGCILYQMVYGHPPFQYLNMYQKMKAIPDGTHVIDFPEFSVPTEPSSRSSQQGTISPPKKLDHLRRRVRPDVIAAMKSCLHRAPKMRATIPEMLDQDWLLLKEPERPDPKTLLQSDETVINPYYMRQLLQYGISLGQKQDTADMSPETLLKEAERLVAELKSLENS